MISDEIVTESSFSKKLLREGMDKGIEKGRLDEARRNVRKIAELRFAELGNPRGLNSIKDPAILEQLFDRLVLAPDAGAARLAIKQIVKR